MPNGYAQYKELASHLRSYFLCIMSDTEPKSLSRLVTDPTSPLGRLATEAAARVALTDHLRAGLGDSAGSHIAGANLRDDGTLVVLATGPEWAARLRFESDRLLTLCRAVYPAAARVRVRVTQGS